MPTDTSNTADTSTWTSLIGNPNSGAPHTIYKWFNTAAFAAPPPFTFGNEGRDVIEGPGLNNWDLSLFKIFRIDERKQFQFRTEFFQRVQSRPVPIARRDVRHGCIRPDHRDFESSYGRRGGANWADHRFLYQLAKRLMAQQRARTNDRVVAHLGPEPQSRWAFTSA